MTPEGQIKSDICKILKQLGIEHYRMQVGRIGKSRYSHGVLKGTADILAFPQNLYRKATQHPVLWIETKVPGKKPSADQLLFAAERERKGHVYIVVESVDHFMQFVNARL